MDSWGRYDNIFREEEDHESHQIVCIVLSTDTKCTAGERLCRWTDRMHMYTVYRLFPFDIDSFLSVIEFVSMNSYVGGAFFFCRTLNLNAVPPVCCVECTQIQFQ